MYLQWRHLKSPKPWLKKVWVHANWTNNKLFIITITVWEVVGQTLEIPTIEGQDVRCNVRYSKGLTCTIDFKMCFSTRFYGNNYREQRPWKWRPKIKDPVNNCFAKWRLGVWDTFMSRGFHWRLAIQSLDQVTFPWPAMHTTFSPFVLTSGQKLKSGKKCRLLYMQYSLQTQLVRDLYKGMILSNTECLRTKTLRPGIHIHSRRLLDE